MASYKGANWLNKVVLAVASTMGFTFTASVYLSRLIFAISGMMLTFAVHRVLWRHLELISPVLPLNLGKVTSAAMIAVWYGLIHISTGSIEAFRKLELSEREQWAYALLGWAHVIISWVGPALILSSIEGPSP